jgi:hypothetical protein
LRRDPERQRPWVMLVDGHEGQREHIHAVIERHGVEVTLILDFIHVLEYLWKAAGCFHAPGSEAAEPWVGERALQILKGKPSEVTAGMRRAATFANSPPLGASRSIPARIICSNTKTCCATTSIWPRGFPSSLGSSKGPAVTSLKIEWTLPVHAGA